MFSFPFLLRFSRSIGATKKPSDICGVVRTGGSGLSSFPFKIKCISGISNDQRRCLPFLLRFRLLFLLPYLSTLLLLPPIISLASCSSRKCRSSPPPSLPLLHSSSPDDASDRMERGEDGEEKEKKIVSSPTILMALSHIRERRERERGGDLFPPSLRCLWPCKEWGINPPSLVSLSSFLPHSNRASLPLVCNYFCVCCFLHFRREPIWQSIPESRAQKKIILFSRRRRRRRCITGLICNYVFRGRKKEPDFKATACKQGEGSPDIEMGGEGKTSRKKEE